MNVAVLGGGMQGCCIALAERGVRVTLYDRNDALLSRASIANEGKMHLGYMYAGDRTLGTAQTMVRGALAFAPFMNRHLGIAPHLLPISDPAVYLVHRDSMSAVDEVAAYIAAVHGILQEAAEGRPEAYFGSDIARPPRRWSKAECDEWFDPELTLAAFESQERSIEPVALAAAVRPRMMADPRLEIVLGAHVTSCAIDGDSVVVNFEHGGKPSRRSFDHVVNALWDGRLAVDATLGFTPKRSWIHRMRYGITAKMPALSRRPPTTTIIRGPFGEMANHGGGILALMWYPVCLAATSRDLLPPQEWPMYPDAAATARMLSGSLAGLAAIIPALRELNLNDASDVQVKGGVIVAWGETDIDDPASELHRRFEIGVTSTGQYHTVDPGKLTMVPYFAEMCARRIADAY